MSLTNELIDELIIHHEYQQMMWGRSVIGDKHRRWAEGLRELRIERTEKKNVTDR